jgi:ATP-dependent DNA helicase RecQ
MQQYAALERGHMQFLLSALDAEADAEDKTALPDLPTTTKPALVAEAQRFLREANMVIEPRKKWPMGGMPLYGKKSLSHIASEEQMAPGRILATLADGGWSARLRAELADGYISDEVVEAAAQLIEAWRPQPPPEWVAYVPTPARPGVVSSFAKRLAQRLNLPLHPALRRVERRPPQREMANSSYQARNVDGAFGVHMPPLPGAVLLVDDTVCSRWTLTAAAWVLRTNGAGVVHPFALARVEGDDGGS